MSRPARAPSVSQAVLVDAVHPNTTSGFPNLADAIWPIFLNACGYDADW